MKLGIHFRHEEQHASLVPPTDGSTWEPTAVTPISKLIDDWYYKVKKKLCDTNFRTVNKLSWADTMLQRTVQEIKKLSVVIKPADKNLGTVLLTAQQYHTLCMQHLTDTATYRKAEYQPERCFDRLEDILDNYGMLYVSRDKEQNSSVDRRKQHTGDTGNNTGHMDNTGNTGTTDSSIATTARKRRRTLERPRTALARSLLQLRATPALRQSYFYVLPKMHKKKLAGRPIVGTINSVTYHTSKYLHNVLAQTLPHLNTVAQSTQHALRRLLTTTAPAGAVLLCADVTSLYPSIPIDYGLRAIREVLTKLSTEQGTPRINIALTLELLHWVLENNYFSYMDDTYHQLTGTAMGTPTAVMYANIVLFYLESTALLLQPILYQRFIDDLCVLCTEVAQAQEIVRVFNAQCPQIQLEEVTIGTTGIFLDLEIRLHQHGHTTQLTTRTFQKSINKYLYICPTSNHQKIVFRNMVFNELCRYRLHCTLPADYRHMVQLFSDRLRRRGYQRSFIEEIAKRIPPRATLLHKLFSGTRQTNHKLPLVLIAEKFALEFIARPTLFFALGNDLTMHPAFNEVFGIGKLLIAQRNDATLQSQFSNERRTQTQVQNSLRPTGTISDEREGKGETHAPAGRKRKFFTPLRGEM